MSRVYSAGLGSLSYNVYKVFTTSDEIYLYAIGCIIGILLIGYVFDKLEGRRENGTISKH